MNSLGKKFFTFITLLTLFASYTNCSDGFVSDSVDQLTSLNDGKANLSDDTYNLEVTLNNSLKIKAKSETNQFQVKFSQNNPLNIPEVIVEGSLCLSEPIESVQVNFSRYLETGAEANTGSVYSKHLLKGKKLKLSKNNFPDTKLCEAVLYNYSYTGFLEGLKIDTSSMKASEDFTFIDNIYLEVSGPQIRQSISNEPFLNQIQKTPFALKPYKFKTPPLDEKPGVWSSWTIKSEGNCVVDKAQVVSERTCSDNLRCLATNGDYLRYEEKIEYKTCVEPGEWSSWVETKIGACENEIQKYSASRSCKNNRFCLSEKGELVKSETKETSKACTSNPPPTELKPLFSKTRNRLRVLFVGNSFQAYNPYVGPYLDRDDRKPENFRPQYIVYRQVLDMIKLSIPNTSGKMISIGGGTLERLWNESNARNEITSGNYDLMVIQGRYDDFTRESYRNGFNQYANRFADLAKSNNLKVVYYGLWARDQLISPNGDTYGPVAHSLYKAAAERHNFSYAPNGMAYGELYKKYSDSMTENEVENKLTQDNIHPNWPTSYMAANVVYSTIFAEPAPSPSQYKPSPLSTEDANLIQTITWKALNEYGHSTD